MDHLLNYNRLPMSEDSLGMQLDRADSNNFSFQIPSTDLIPVC